MGDISRNAARKGAEKIQDTLVLGGLSVLEFSRLREAAAEPLDAILSESRWPVAVFVVASWARWRPRTRP